MNRESATSFFGGGISSGCVCFLGLGTGGWESLLWDAVYHYPGRI